MKSNFIMHILLIVMNKKLSSNFQYNFVKLLSTHTTGSLLK